LCTTWAAQSQPAKSENALQVREQHLDALAIAPGLLEGVSPGECASTPLGGSFLPFQIYRLAGRRGTE